jgi:hypothetical protein
MGLVPPCWGGLLWLPDAVAELTDVDDWDATDVAAAEGEASPTSAASETSSGS